jgi:hypothetical protein
MEKGKGILTNVTGELGEDRIPIMYQQREQARSLRNCNAIWIINIL